MTDASYDLTPRDDLAPGLLLGEGVELGADIDFGPGCVIHAGAVLGDACELGSHVVVHAGTKLGTGVVIGDHAVVGKQVRLAAASTASRKRLEPLEVADAVTIGAHAVLNAGSRIG